MVNFLNFQNVNDRHGHIDVDRDDCFQHFVETERSYLLVVVFLCLRNRKRTVRGAILLEKRNLLKKKITNWAGGSAGFHKILLLS